MADKQPWFRAEKRKDYKGDDAVVLVRRANSSRPDDPWADTGSAYYLDTADAESVRTSLNEILGADRAAVIAFLRSLPAGGIAEVVKEAKVCTWSGRVLVREPASGRYLAEIGRAFTGVNATGWWATWGTGRGAPAKDFADEPTASAWVETKARESGWTIAKDPEPAALAAKERNDG